MWCPSAEPPVRPDGVPSCGPRNAAEWPVKPLRTGRRDSACYLGKERGVSTAMDERRARCTRHRERYSSGNAGCLGNAAGCPLRTSLFFVTSPLSKTCRFAAMALRSSVRLSERMFGRARKLEPILNTFSLPDQRKCERQENPPSSRALLGFSRRRRSTVGDYDVSSRSGGGHYGAALEGCESHR